jgi:DNA-binding GntR family transcriptional regulator
MPRLINMLDIAWNLTEPAQTMMRVSDAQREVFLADHQLMLDAFTRNDVEALREATSAHEDHLTAAMGRMIDLAD